MEKKKIGVVVGRFQIPDLHDGHKELLNHVFQHNDEVIIFVGCGQKYSFTNPLPYNYIVNRLNHNLLHHTKKYFIKSINDCREDDMWNKCLDEAILKHLELDMNELNNFDICLYGSRDSFLKTYQGIFRNELVSNSIQHVSATIIRKGYHKFVDEDSIDWAKGVIHATGNLYPTSYQCVDIACLHYEKTKHLILLGKKQNQNNWRLPGGFVDPTDNSLEEAALRELEEETDIRLSKVDYCGSYRINDYRYVKEPHKIMTSLFVCYSLSLKCLAKDDLEEVKWFNLYDLPENIVDEHKILIQNVQKNIK